MRGIPALVALILVASTPTSAGDERCDQRPNGGGRICIREISDMKITSVADGTGDIEMVTVDVRNRGRKSTATDALALIGGTMMALAPTSTQATRAAVMTKLLAKAGSGKPNTAMLGRYQWAMRFAGNDMLVYADRKYSK